MDQSGITLFSIKAKNKTGNATVTFSTKKGGGYGMRGKKMEGNMFFGIISFFLKRKWTCKIYFLLLTAFFFSLSIGTVKGAGQLLCDSGFEDSTANGTFPTSGCWKSSSAGGGAYAVVTTTAAYNGNNGLWIYTGTETWAYWSRPYQEFDASAGQVYTAKAWIRTPSGES